MNTFPIALAWNPAPNSTTYMDLNSLGTIIAQQMQANVAANVSFFLSGAVDPTTNLGVIFYNQTTNTLKYWSTATGSYLPVGFQFVSALPMTNQGLVYLTSSNSFWFWGGSSYQPVSNAVVGDCKFNYTAGDQLTTGFVSALGSRTIDSITALSVTQNAALHTLFGDGALIQIPNITAPVSTVAGGGGGGGTLYPLIYCGF